jgi:hypothetical protein
MPRHPILCWPAGEKDNLSFILWGVTNTVHLKEDPASIRQATPDAHLSLSLMARPNTVREQDHQSNDRRLMHKFT